MNSEIKRIISFSVLLVFILSIFSVASLCSSAESPEERTIIVELEAGEENAEYNWHILDEAISQANEKILLTVSINTPGTYYIGKEQTPAAIRLRPNTVLDLNGSTLLRSGKMGNMIQGCDYDGNTANGVGYDLTGNITVKNGTFDGSGGTDNDNSNIFNFGHASGITIDNVTLKNSKGGHLIEFTGCENVTVTNCRFDGYLNADLKSAVEAIQFDICSTNITTGEKSWNGVYCTDEGGADNTPCRNVVIDSCSFLNFPSAIGNHKGVKGKYTSNVTISDCYFNNTLDSAQPAIWAYNFKDSVISDNSISGNYSHGIYLSGGSNTIIKNNSIILSGTSIYITVASASYVIDSNGTKDNVYVSNCKVLNNNLTTVSSVPAVCVYTSSHISEFSGNDITASNAKAVTITTESKADLIKNNTIESAGVTDDSYGLHLAGSTVGTVSGNTVKSYAHSIQVSSAAKVTTISGNTVSSRDADGIYVTASTVDTISSNTVSDCAADSIEVINSSTAKTISNNKITNSGNNAVRIAKSTVTTVSGNTINKAADCGIYVSESTVTNVTGNYINKCTNSGIKTTSNAKSVIKKVFGNAVFSSTDYGIRLNNSSSTVQLGNNAVKYNKPDGIKNNGKTTAINKAGWCQAGSKWFYFNSDGAYRTGWQKISKKWYYFDKYGQMKTGWLELNKKWYYFNSSGVMKTGWLKSGGKWYYFNSSGVMKTGWLSLGGKWYYMNSSGAMLANCSQKIGKKTYKFDKNGVCLNP